MLQFSNRCLEEKMLSVCLVFFIKHDLEGVLKYSGRNLGLFHSADRDRHLNSHFYSASTCTIFHIPIPQGLR
jgi:hypothetical protein